MFGNSVQATEEWVQAQIPAIIKDYLAMSSKDKEDSEKEDSEKIASIVPVKADKGMLKTEEKVVNGEILSSEDEDGFPLDKKRKRKTDDEESAKKRFLRVSSVY